MDLYGMQGKVALVTGGTSGIGAATARLYGKAGCKVLVVGRDAARGQVVADDIVALGTQAAFHQADLANDSAAAGIVDAAVQRFGGLDIAFNNAGYRESNALLGDQSIEEFDAVMRLNLRSVFLCMKAQIAAMKAHGGVIVNNASVSAIRNSIPGLGLYAASKAALVALTRTAAMEYAGQGIRINSVAPGRIDTPMVRSNTAIDLAKVGAAQPAGRLGTEDEAAQAVLWLSSPASSYVIGHTLCVDGGFLAQ